MGDAFLTQNIKEEFKAPDGLTAQTAAESAEAILQAYPNSPNGAYYIETTSGVSQVYCDMVNGGYMLVGKISNSTASPYPWFYNGSNWTTTSPVNETTMADLSNNNGVSRLYYEYPLTTGFRMGLNTINNVIPVNVSGQVARSYFTGSQINLSIPRSSFMTWIQTAGTASSNWNNQLNCNRVGFNRGDSSGSFVRFGISLNNENDCNSNDAAIGFGTYTNNQTTPAQGVRNVAAGGHRWSPDARYPYQGFIFVK
jgi:hypothetical protein